MVKETCWPLLKFIRIHCFWFITFLAIQSWRWWQMTSFENIDFISKRSFVSFFIVWNFNKCKTSLIGLCLYNGICCYGPVLNVMIVPWDFFHHNALRQIFDIMAQWLWREMELQVCQLEHQLFDHFFPSSSEDVSSLAPLIDPL